ncbi:MAG: hypothetical protein NTZ78_03170 [Candidatus Aureabacteria bacterium]|nr:hypothetical protein [Candidatus Auribacterota bacterium]
MKSPERSIPFCIFLVSLAVFSLARMQIVSLNAEGRRQAWCLAGDEPSYLLITHSIVMDGDFNLYNQCTARDSRFFGVEKCGGHAARRDLNKKEVYSIHLPGLPLLLATPYALALRAHLSPRAMVCLFMNIISALLAAQIYLLCREVCAGDDSASTGTRGVWMAIASTAAVVFTPPVIFYSNLAYPELPGALLILYVFRHAMSPATAASRELFSMYRSVDVSACGRQNASLLSSNAVAPSRRYAVTLTRVIVSLCISLLPWLSFRFLPAALILLCMLLTQKRTAGTPRWPVLLLCGGVFVLSLALLLSYQYRAFGTVSLSAGYNLQDFGSRGFMGTGGILGLLGLLLDQGHGLLAWSPVYLLSFSGIVLLVRERRAQGLWIFILLVAVYLPAASFVHWWGGFAPPPRFMVAAVPLLGGALCYALCRTQRISFGMVFGALLALSLAFGYLGCVHPLSLYRHAHILTKFYPEVVSRIFPSFIHLRRSTWPLAILWLILIIGVTGHYTAKRNAGVRGDSERP